MTELSRTSALASRHKQLGSGLEDWNGMGTAWSYRSDPEREHDAVREAAGLFDMSPLKKVYLRGPDAMAVLDHVMTRDMSRVEPGRSVYGAVLSEQGTVSDDAIAANNGNNEWLYCHGSGESMARLEESARSKNVSIQLDDDLHNLALQGPASLAFLDRFAADDLAAIPYFGHIQTDLFGHRVQLSRTGYSGERGYEILAAAADVGDIWDNIVGQGQDQGIMPASFTALDKVRIEAGLLFYGYDMTEDHSPWEVGLGFTINKAKSGFRGKAAALASLGKERFTQAGLVIDHPEALVGGEVLLHNGEEVGVINSPGYSHRLQQSLALGHLRPDLNNAAVRLDVRSDSLETTATVGTLPFYDPQKSRTHS